MAASRSKSTSRAGRLQVDLHLRMRGEEARQAAAPASSRRTTASAKSSARRRGARRTAAAPAPAHRTGAATRSNSWRPSPVSSTPRALRTNRRWPSRSSSPRIWWLSALTVRCRDSAARDRLPMRAAATKPCRACSGGRPWLARHLESDSTTCLQNSRFSAANPAPILRIVQRRQRTGRRSDERDGGNHEHLQRPAVPARLHQPGRLPGRLEAQSAAIRRAHRGRRVRAAAGQPRAVAARFGTSSQRTAPLPEAGCVAGGCG